MGAAQGDELKSARFRRERQKGWAELDRLVSKVEARGIRSLKAEELGRLPGLYRAALSGLSVARAISLDKSLLEYLENLAARSYLCVYGPKRGFLAATRDFLRIEFPVAVRRHCRSVFLAYGFLILGVAVGWWLTAIDSEWFYSFVGEGMAQGRGPEASTETLRNQLYSGGDQPGGLSVFASFLFSHNSQVMLLCFALGAAFGIPTSLLLFQNGLMLGAMTAVHAAHGLLVDWWLWILPHGVTELSAIVIGGAGGLVIAQSMIFPGRSRRLDLLRVQGPRAGVLAMGAVVMLLLAALIEGFFRQLVTDKGLRAALSVGTAILWLLYFSRAGRGGRS